MSKPADKYWWFLGASVTELTKRLNATPDARLEVYLDGDKMTFEVRGTDAGAVAFDPPINESHVCPPQCP